MFKTDGSFAALSSLLPRFPVRQSTYRSAAPDHNDCMYLYVQWQQDNIETNEAKTTRRECKVYHFPHCKHLNSVKSGPERILAPIIIGREIQDFQNILTRRTPEHCSLLDGRSKEHTSSIQHSKYKHKLYPATAAHEQSQAALCDD